ncbi:MAG: YraN family protein [Actinomycetota bacterium]
MGMGSLPQEPLRTASASDEFQRSEHRRTSPARRLTPQQRAVARMARARWAEDLVARFYERSGYEIVERNWHCREGELDIVAVLASPVRVIIAIVEVKARASINYGSPFEAVTQVKQKKLRIAATKFLASHRDLHGEIRFDVVAVLGTQLDVLQNAF